ncbi:MAG TPA: glycogen debranching N-terminal domain-containing protein [Longimicrobiales bacterium]
MRADALPAEARQRDQLRCAWRGPSLVALGRAGWPADDALSGYWFRQTRFLSGLRLRLAGRDPDLCSTAEIAPEALEATFIHPEVSAGGGGGTGSGGTPGPDGLLHRDIDVRVAYVVHPASLHVRVVLVNRWQSSVQLPVEWLLDADFVTVDEATFGAGAPERRIDVVARASSVEFRCTASGLELASRVSAHGADFDWRGRSLRATVRLARQHPVELTLRVRAHDAQDPIDDAGATQRERRLADWSSSRLRFFAAAGTPMVTIAERAAADLGSLALLEGPAEEWLTPAAGVPAYQALWARDALTATWQSGIVDGGAMLGSVLSTLTRLQGRVDDPARDEQPGRILNQSKRDLQSRLGLTGFDRSYADVASPFMYLIGLGYHYALTGDRAAVAARYEAANRVVDWALRDGDRDGDGFIEYLTRAPQGPPHQAWKDSDNAVVDGDGSQVEPPIAACEIQGYWFVSLQFMSVLALVMGERRRARDLWRRARELKRRFNERFWMEDEGYLAFGLGPDKQPIRALTSNAAQCLATGIVARRHIPRLVRRMFEPDLFSGWGIRTLSSGNAAYNPLDYHLGSVWPVENASIAFGLRRYGFDDRVEQLVRALYDLALLWPQARTPECVGGYARDELAHPGVYARANRPQTWNQSAWPLLVQCLLGMAPVAPLKLLLIDPKLPAWLPELSLRGLRVGEATVDLRFERRADGHTSCDILEQDGALRIVRQPWLESFSADSITRVAALARSMAGRSR